jgi:cyanophycinase
MKNLLILVFLLSSSLWADTNLFLFGGGKRAQEALKEFVKASGDDHASILVIPWASEDNEGSENIKRDLRPLTNGRIEIASTDPHELKLQMSKATGIFFSGGIQTKLMGIMNQHNLRSVFKKLYAEGVAFAGTSAGTAIMSERMFTGEGDFDVMNGAKVEIAEGLGLLPPNVIVDQHFILRARYNRLLGVVLLYNALGIGIDEDNVLHIRNNLEAHAYGPTQVLIFRPIGNRKVEIDIFQDHESADLGQYSSFFSHSFAFSH